MMMMMLARAAAGAVLIACVVAASSCASPEHLPLERRVASAFDCKHVKAHDYLFDLSPIHFPVTIESSEITPPTITKTSITINLCEDLANDGGPSEEQCPAGTRVCMKVSNDKKGDGERVTQVIAAAGGDPEAAGNQADLGDRLSGAERALELELYGALYADRRQKTKIDLRCNPSASKHSLPTIKKYDREDGELKLMWESPFACAKKMGSPNDDDSSDGDKSRPDGEGTGRGNSGSSWGLFSWFFFFVIVGGGIYLAAGLWRNYNEYGVIELPNKDFWREAPYIAKDVGKHIYSTVSGQGTSRGAYEPV